MSTSLAWDERYQNGGFEFGEAPNLYLQSQAHRLRPTAGVETWDWRENAFDVVALFSSPCRRICESPLTPTC